MLYVSEHFHTFVMHNIYSDNNILIAIGENSISGIIRIEVWCMDFDDCYFYDLCECVDF